MKNLSNPLNVTSAELTLIRTYFQEFDPKNFTPSEPNSGVKPKTIKDSIKRNAYINKVFVGQLWTLGNSNPRFGSNSIEKILKEDISEEFFNSIAENDGFYKAVDTVPLPSYTEDGKVQFLAFDGLRRLLSLALYSIRKGESLSEFYSRKVPFQNFSFDPFNESQLLSAVSITDLSSNFGNNAVMILRLVGTENPDTGKIYKKNEIAKRLNVAAPLVTTYSKLKESPEIVSLIIADVIAPSGGAAILKRVQNTGESFAKVAKEVSKIYEANKSLRDNPRVRAKEIYDPNKKVEAVPSNLEIDSTLPKVDLDFTDLSVEAPELDLNDSDLPVGSTLAQAAKEEALSELELSNTGYSPTITSWNELFTKLVEFDSRNSGMDITEVLVSLQKESKSPVPDFVSIYETLTGEEA